MSEVAILVAIGAALTGAIFSTLQGYANRPTGEGYSLRKLFGGLIGSAFMSFTVVNLLQVPDTLSSVGFAGLIIVNLIAGFGIDKSLSASKK